jgi:hypothetical protein
VGRVQLDPHGHAEPAGAQGDRRRGRHRRPLPGRRALHGRHDARRLVGDEHGSGKRDARRAGLPGGRRVLRRALRRATVDADLQAAAARRPVLGSHGAEDPVRCDQDSDLRHRRVVRRIPRQRAADAGAPEGAGEGDRRPVEPRVAARAVSEARDRVASRGRPLVRSLAQGASRAWRSTSGRGTRPARDWRRRPANGGTRTAGRSPASASGRSSPVRTARSPSLRKASRFTSCATCRRWASRQVAR